MSRSIKVSIFKDDGTRYCVFVEVNGLKYGKCIHPDGTLQQRTDCRDGESESEGTTFGTYKTYKKALKALNKYLILENL